MKFIISNGHTKRELIGSFGLCGSIGDLRELAEQILLQIGEAESPNLSYGWVQISERVRTLTNTPSKGWDE